MHHLSAHWRTFGLERSWVRITFVSVLLSGCAGERRHLHFAEYDKAGRLVSNEAQCVAENGAWLPAGMLGTPMCNFVPADAGKPCTDSAQCESKWITATRVPYHARVKGVCDDSFLPFGCMHRVHAGRAGQALCVD